ncbi:hypothetical protein niasHT_005972 [Heterodera trifolii]|uniref:Peptidase S1 domain-containing protein n=1 Tax=Heterodera trifolii TaxID=157864 RepID=A0ABD2LWZ7_9BILA
MAEMAEKFVLPLTAQNFRLGGKASAYNTSKKEWHLNATDVKQRVTEHRQDRTNVFIHPNYNSETVVFDLALIKLSHPLKAPPFQPICINCGAANKFRNGTVFVSGWGQLEDNCKKTTTSSKVLMGRYAKLINCQKESEAEGQICVEPNILQHGDSGSALLASNGTAFVQIGVHSSGICNTKSNESVEALYTPLDKEWIDDITGFNCPVQIGKFFKKQSTKLLKFDKSRVGNSSKSSQRTAIRLKPGRLINIHQKPGRLIVIRQKPGWLVNFVNKQSKELLIQQKPGRLDKFFKSRAG